MPKSRSERERSAFGQRMFEARTRAGLTQMQVRKALGVSQGTLSDLEGEGQTSGMTPQYAELYRVNAHWLATGEGQRDQVQRGVDHPLSQIGPIVSPTTIEWGDLMTEPLPAAFSLVFRDDAMAPDFPISSIGRFATDRQPVPGRPVLVADSAGNAYIRDYRPRTAEHWLAVARNPAYQPLDSASDGLRVLAVMTGHDWP